MLRVFSAAVAGLILFSSLVQAGDYRGYLKVVDKDKITVTVQDKDKDKDKDLEIKTDGTTQFIGGKEAISPTDLTKMLKDAEAQGVRVHVVTKGTGPEEVATEVRVAGKKR